MKRGEFSPVDTVCVSALAPTPALGDLQVVLEPGVQRLDGVVWDEESPAVLVMLRHSPGAGLSPVISLETELEDVG